MSAVRVSAADARARAGAALGRFVPAGSRDVEEADADLAARALVAGDASGWPEFGLAMLVREAAAHPSRTGTVPLAPGAGPPAPRDGDRTAQPLAGGAVRLLDATALPGPLALAAAVRQAGDLARALGTGAVGVRHAGSTGRVGAYLRTLADDGLIGMVLAHSGPRVAPFGGSAAVVGTNPLALAAPRADGALVVDAATSAITLAELHRHRADGTPLPVGAALDEAGGPTRVAGATAALLPGGLLGSLLGLVVETLAGALVGAREDPPGRGLLVVAFDPLAFGTPDLPDQVERLSRQWVEAGGHVPGSRPEQADFDVDSGVWATLGALAERGRP